MSAKTDLSERATTNERREGEGSGSPRQFLSYFNDFLPSCRLPLFGAMRGHEKTTSRGGFVVGTGEFLVCFDLIGGDLTTSTPSRGRGAAPLYYSGIVTFGFNTDNWVTSDNFALSIAIIDHVSCVDMIDKHEEYVLRT